MSKSVGATPGPATTPAATTGTTATTATPTVAATTTSTTVVAPLQPPKFGGIADMSPTEQAVWTGGMPEPDWSGLNPNISDYTSPNQLRPTQVTYAQRGWNLRRKGLEVKFKKGDDVAKFAKNVWEHLTDNGLDTIAYLNDPNDPTKIMSVVDDYTRFTIEEVKTLSAKRLPFLDRFGIEDDKAAREFLLDSIDEVLCDQIKQKMKPSDPFVLAWMILNIKVQSTSIDRYESVKVQIRVMKPSTYPGQNLETMAFDYSKLALELTKAGQYDHSLTLHMLKSFQSAGGDGIEAEDYRHKLRNTHEELDEALVKICHMTKLDADAYMLGKDLTYISICELVESKYRAAVDNKVWPPARNLHDSKTPPRNFGAVNVAMSKSQASAFALFKTQEADRQAGRGTPCHNCGKLGHWARECPSPAKKSGGSGPGKAGPGVPGKGRGGPGNNGTRGDAVTDLSFTWKTTAPSNGEKEEKTVSSRTFYWCAHCGRWSPTHNTAQHTGNKTSAANLGLVVDPSAWHTDLTSPPTVSEICNIFGPSVLAMAFTYILLTFGPFLLQYITPCAIFMATNPWILPPLTMWISLILTVLNINRIVATTVAVAAPSLSRREIRHREAHYRRATRQHMHAQKSPGSIHQHGLHRRYPLNLRSLGHYVNAHAPTVDQRNFKQYIEAMHQLVREMRQKNSTRNSQRHNERHEKTCHYEQRATAAPQCNMVLVESSAASVAALAMRSILQAPDKFRQVIPKEATFKVIWDSGASIAISPSKEEFVGEYRTVGPLTVLKGLAKGLKISGQGHVMWAFQDTTGQLRMIKVPAFHVPSARARLLSTSSLLQEHPKETILISGEGGMVLSGIEGDTTRGSVKVDVDINNNLPTAVAYRYDATTMAPEALTSTISTVAAENINISEPEKELLRWHYRLGHLDFKKIVFLFRSGILSHVESTRRLHASASKLTAFPKCAACQFGKQCRRTAPGTTTTAVQDRAGVLKKDHLVPGQRVSVDHFVCHTKGRLFTSKGKTSDDSMYCGGCLFIDHASNYVHVEFQKVLNSHETARAKALFEFMCRDFGVIPQSYLSDNGAAFTSAEFATHLSAFQQVMRFAGVGAHHHNGNAERAIRTIISISRTMMLHASIHWPEVSDVTLWPMAVSHAVFLHNHVPDPSTGLSAHDLFTRQRWEQRKFQDLHVWGCPVYVLEKSLADGMKIPKWKPRSHRSANVGMSAKHASTVPLVLNIASGAITAQFHVVFDDWFATVTSTDDSIPDFNGPTWTRLFGESEFQFPYEEPEDPTLEDYTPQDIVAQDAQAHREAVAGAMSRIAPPLPLPYEPTPVNPVESKLVSPVVPTTPMNAILTPTMPVYERTSDAPLLQIESSLKELPPISDLKGGQLQLDNHPVTTGLVTPPLLSPSREAVDNDFTRECIVSAGSQRENTPNKGAATRTPVTRRQIPPTPQEPRRSARLHGKQGTTRPWAIARNDIHFAPTTFPVSPDISPQFFLAIHQTGIEEQDFFVFKASPVSDPDSVTWEQGLAGPDREQWIKATTAEIEGLESKNTWDEVDFASAGSKVLPGTWVLRVKRTPDGTIRKYKARFCVRGDLMEEEADTHSPVVAWSTVRLFLILSITLNWYSCSIDFSNAFVQAKLKSPIWIHLPRGFASSRPGRTCLRLSRSLYGLTFAGRLWYEHLSMALLSLGFKQSSIDKCLFYKKNILLVLYCDDCGIAAPTKGEVDELVDALIARGFELTREGSFSDFLGIKLTQDPITKSVELTQVGLIKRILNATGMNECTPNWTPASVLALGTDPDGEPMEEDWNYRSIIGMLLYLTTNTRPDICFAVSQAARFSHAPKKSHATAVKMIVRYLAGTRDKGTIVSPTQNLDLDCYVDADFGGLYRREPDIDTNSVRSRTGYIITLSDCPLTWKSQLQSEICLSTLESEYVALSQTLRTLLPLKRLLQELATALELPTELISSIRCRAFEDNQGCLILATTHRLTNRTRYLHVKYHWFWSHHRNGEFSILKIGTLVQRADYMTKGLGRDPFEDNRKLSQGW